MKWGGVNLRRDNFSIIFISNKINDIQGQNQCRTLTLLRNPSPLQTARKTLVWYVKNSIVSHRAGSCLWCVYSNPLQLGQGCRDHLQRWPLDHSWMWTPFWEVWQTSWHLGVVISKRNGSHFTVPLLGLVSKSLADFCRVLPGLVLYRQLSL